MSSGNSRNSKNSRNLRNRIRGGYEEALDENALISQRNQTDNLFQSNSLTNSNNIYDTVASVNYDENVGTRGGSRGGCSCNQNKQLRQSGGCFTCPKGKKKLNMLTNIFAKLIPKLYAQYKKNPSKSPGKVKNNKKVLKGGLLDWSDWDGSYKWQPNPQSGVYKYDENILNTNFLNLSADRKNQGIYNVDTSLTDYTSALAR